MEAGMPITVLQHSDPCPSSLVAHHTVTAADTVLLRFALWNPDGSLHAASNESYPYSPHWHFPNQVISCHPQISCNTSFDSCVLDIHILAIGPRSSESCDQWIKRLDEIKAEANRVYSLNESQSSHIDAILLYQAGASLIRAQLNNQSDPQLVQLLASFHCNMSQVYLALNEPVHAESQARDVYYLAHLPQVPTALQKAGPLYQMLADTCAYPVRFVIPDLMLIKAAYRLCRALLDRGMDKLAIEIMQDAGHMFGTDTVQSHFAVINSRLHANALKSKALAQKMVKDFDAIKPKVVPADHEPEVVVPDYVADYHGEVIEPVSEEMLALQWEAAYEEMNSKFGDLLAGRNGTVSDPGKIEWSEESDPGSESENEGPVRKKPSNVLTHFNSDEEDDTDAPMPELQVLVPGRISLEQIHAELAKSYQPRSMYPLLKLVNIITTNYAGIRPWIKRWPSITITLVDHIITQLVHKEKVQLMDISAKQKNALKRPTWIRINDLINATLKGKSIGIIDASEEDDEEEEELGDQAEEPQVDLNDLDLGDIGVPFTGLAQEQSGLRFMIAPNPLVHYRSTELDIARLCGERVTGLDTKYVHILRDLIQKQFPVYGSYKLETVVKMVTQLKIQTPVPPHSKAFVLSNSDRIKAYIGELIRLNQWELIDVRMPGGAKVYVPGGGELQYP